ncbi:MAG: universal stress protein [Peptococcaceae bacterium]|nr:universal stress protein [Peptococcaceae bacterium]
MFKNILVPTDGSDYARRALTLALEIAQKFDAAIELLHVAHVPQIYWGEPYAAAFTVPMQEMVEKGGEQILLDTLKDIAIGTTKIDKRQIVGYPSSVILDEINAKNIDLVVIGRHGHSGLAGAMLGSVSNRVVAHATCPVLVVK